MKNALKYYYNIDVKDIRQMNNYYMFEIDNRNYLLTTTYMSSDKLNEIYKFHLNLLRYQFNCHQIILNHLNQIVTYINKEPYILLEIKINNREIVIDDLTFFSKTTFSATNKSLIKSESWSKLWMDKIDYFEYQISQFGKKYPIIRESISYYIGLTETAIQLATSMESKQETFVIAHNRVRTKTNLSELYNPLNFVLDLQVRDIAEYYKDKLNEGYEVLEEMKQYVYYNNLSQYECIMLLARFIYPSYYFDIYEAIISGNSKEEELQKVISNVSKFESNIKGLYAYVKSYQKIPDIEWLNY